MKLLTVDENKVLGSKEAQEAVTEAQMNDGECFLENAVFFYLKPCFLCWKSVFAEHRVTNILCLTVSERLEFICVISILCICDETLLIRHTLNHRLPPEQQTVITGWTLLNNFREKLSGTQWQREKDFLSQRWMTISLPTLEVKGDCNDF